jgi:TRAP-type C4-dicarboxylate transport system permease small subunit
MSHHKGHSDDSVEPVGNNPLEKIASGAVHVAAIVLQIAAVALVVNAIYRYTVGGGFPVIDEGARFSLMIVVFLGLAGTHIIGGHVKVDLLLSALPKRAKVIINGYLVPLASMFFLALLGWSGWVSTLKMYNLGTTTPSQPYITMWPLSAVIPFGCGLLFLILLLHLLRRISRAFTRDVSTQD